jgi:hypothetical protein
MRAVGVWEYSMQFFRKMARSAATGTVIYQIEWIILQEL